jgi:hypothetical protein
MKIALRLGLVALQLVVGLTLVNRAAFAADEDKFLGTWALNPAKSSAPAGAVPSSATVVLTKSGSDMYKSVSDTTLAGQPLHSETTFKTDGKDYSPVTTPAPPPGTPSITQSFERVSAAAYKTLLKINGMVIATILYEVSADGKTLTSTTTGVGAAANVTATLVFDRK